MKQLTRYNSVLVAGMVMMKLHFTFPQLFWRRHLWYSPEHLILLCTMALAYALLLPQPSAAKEHRSEEIVGYFTEWGTGAPSNPYTLKNVASSGAAGILTQLDYAFGKVVDDHCQIANSEIALQHRYDAATSVNGSD
ncbi:MAG TPA: hypothetical protein VJV96_10400, partial [Candidatus Angelobacter sp.]|nr:hypothetical protein [Candidatus Angelobacter sp.]